MYSEFLYDDSELLIALVLLGTLLLASECGYRLGLRSRTSIPEVARAQLGGIQSALAGLFALLLGFTFAMALSRYESRRQTVVREANAIGTAAHRARLLPAEQRAEAARLFRRYVGVRVAAAHGPNLATPELAQLDAEAGRLQEQLWQRSAAAAEADPRSVFRARGGDRHAGRRLASPQPLRHAPAEGGELAGRADLGGVTGRENLGRTLDEVDAIGEMARRTSGLFADLPGAARQVGGPLGELLDRQRIELLAAIDRERQDLTGFVSSERAAALSAVGEERRAALEGVATERAAALAGVEEISKRSIQDASIRARGVVDYVFVRALILIVLAVLFFAVAYRLARGGRGSPRAADA